MPPENADVERNYRLDMLINGTVIGYDPGGNWGHGLAKFFIKKSSIIKAHTETLENSEKVIQAIKKESPLLSIGVDTLTCWGTGGSGWRPADRWLKEKYSEIQNSVVSPNGLYGSMGLNGMAVLIAMRNDQKEIIVTETHPKVLFWCLTGKKYNYKDKKALMDNLLITHLDIEIYPDNEHEWDAAISAFAALQGLKGKWKHNLHDIPCVDGERLITPCGKTHYFWPE
jgi:hypothetical protein